MHAGPDPDLQTQTIEGASALPQLTRDESNPAGNGIAALGNRAGGAKTELIVSV